MIDASAIKEIRRPVEPQTFEVGGTTYSTIPLHDPRQKDPVPQHLKIATLSGLVRYVNSNFDKDTECAAVHVASHKEVWLMSKLAGHFHQRKFYLLAAFEELFGGGFRFGTFYSQEVFIVGLQTLFAESAVRADILKVIGTIKENSVREHSDDGVTQEVSAKAGVALISGVAVPNPVKLRPYRTFRELEQPESNFVLRVRPGQADAPEIALFEADGGLWKLEAIDWITFYLTEKLSIPIIS